MKTQIILIAFFLSIIFGTSAQNLDKNFVRLFAKQLKFPNKLYEKGEEGIICFNFNNNKKDTTKFEVIYSSNPIIIEQLKIDIYNLKMKGIKVYPLHVTFLIHYSYDDFEGENEGIYHDFFSVIIKKRLKTLVPITIHKYKNDLK